MRIDVLKCDVCNYEIPKNLWSKCENVLSIDYQLMGCINPKDICQTCQIWIIKIINSNLRERRKQKEKIENIK